MEEKTEAMGESSGEDGRNGGIAVDSHKKRSEEVQTEGFQGDAEMGVPSLSAQQWAEVMHPGAQSHDNKADTSGRVPGAVEGMLATVAASIMHSATGMSSWGIADLTLGLYKLYGRHSREGATDTISGSLVTSIDEMKQMQHWLTWAIAAYKQEKRELVSFLEIKEEDVLEHVTKSDMGEPAYYVAVDHVGQCVVLGIRGTFSATDVLTDLKPHCENFSGGYAHSGMLASARWICENVAGILQGLLMTYPRYRLVLTGHSLGAGTASLLCYLLRESESLSGENVSTILGVHPYLITCWGFGCPPCVDRKLAEQANFIKNVVHQDDIVARMSPAAVEDLREEIANTDWGQALVDGSTTKKVVDLAQASYAALQGSKPALDFVTKVRQQGSVAAVALTAELATGWTKAAKGTYGKGAERATSWLSWGMATAANQVAAAGNRMTKSMLEQQEQIASKTDAALATAVLATDGASNKENRAALERTRLFTPGVLYHVFRKPFQLQQVPDIPSTKSNAEAVGSSSQDMTAIRNRLDVKVTSPIADNVISGKELSVTENKQPKEDFSYLIMRGNNPSSRFSRIILSSSIISDHLCVGLQEGILKAIEYRISELSAQS